ncbi:hypothetical protein LINPERHAP2_LOCUS6507 [Linum perenne]
MTTPLGVTQFQVPIVILFIIFGMTVWVFLKPA